VGILIEALEQGIDTVHVHRHEVRRVTQQGAELLAVVGESPFEQLAEEGPIRDLHNGLSSSSERDDRGPYPRLRHEARRAHVLLYRKLVVQLCVHAENSVVFASRFRREPLGDIPLERHQDVTRQHLRGTQLHENAAAGSIRQIRDPFRDTRSKNPVKIKVEHISVYEFQIGRFPEPGLEKTAQSAVFFDCDDPLRALHQLFGHDAKARADFEYDVVQREVGKANPHFP